MASRGSVLELGNCDAYGIWYTRSEARLRPAHDNDDDADGDGAFLGRDPLTEIFVLFELPREPVSLFLYFIQTSEQLRDLLALRVGESLGGADAVIALCKLVVPLVLVWLRFC